MYRSLLLILSLALIGSPSFADDLTLVQEHSAHLNRYYPTLFLKADVSKPQRLSRVARQLNQLEDVLQGELTLKNNSLDTLSCSHCVCSGCAQK